MDPKSIQIGTIDNLSFGESKFFTEALKRGNYNNYRAHGHQLVALARELGIRCLFQVKYDQGTKKIGSAAYKLANKLDDFGIALEHYNYDVRYFEMTKQDIIEEYSKDFKHTYGVLLHHFFNPFLSEDVSRLQAFIDNSEKIIIWSSDYDYVKRDNTRMNTSVLAFLLDTELHATEELRSLRDSILTKLKVVCYGWQSVYELTRLAPELQVNLEGEEIGHMFFPQSINLGLKKMTKANRNIDSIFHRPYSGFFMGRSEFSDKLLEELSSSELKALLISYRSDTLPANGKYRYVTQLLQAGTGIEILPLINLGSLCKVHMGMNSWRNLHPELSTDTREVSDMSYNHTFKVFEAYYCGMVPTNPRFTIGMYIEFAKNIPYNILLQFFQKMEENYGETFLKEKVSNLKTLLK